LFTWGAYSSGALGLGDPACLEPGVPGGFADQQSYQTAMIRRRGTPPGVERPTEVTFDHEGGVKKGFCFAVTAAGWHSGALVIDLEVHYSVIIFIPFSFICSQERKQKRPKMKIRTRLKEKYNSRQGI
jgi:hypothetical protein